MVPRPHCVVTLLERHLGDCEVGTVLLRLLELPRTAGLHILELCEQVVSASSLGERAGGGEAQDSRGGWWENWGRGCSQGSEGIRSIQPTWPRSVHQPPVSQGSAGVAVPSCLKTLWCQRAAPSQPLKSRRALYCSIITRSQMVFWELPSSCPPPPPSFIQKQAPALMLRGWARFPRCHRHRSVGTGT